jgi:hypothetical protein
VAAAAVHRQPIAAWVGALTVVLYGALAALVVLTQPQGVLAFAHIGTHFSEGDPNGTVGYDGQFAYFIARDGAAAEPLMDGATLRFQRILYPVAARALALGRADAVPWALVLLNVAGHGLACGLLAALIRQLGGQPWSALVYTLWIGAIFALRFNLHEILCAALALGAVTAYVQGRWRWAVALLILATAAKEIGLLTALGLGLHAALARGRWRWAALLVGGPTLYFLIWWGVMRLWFGRLPLGYPAAKLHVVPFEGMFSVLYDPLQFGMLLLWLGLPTVTLLAAALWAWRRLGRLTLSTALLLPTAGFVVAMPDVSWQDPVAAYRVAILIVPMGLLFVAEHCPERWRLLASVWMPAALVAFLVPGLWAA